MPTKTLSNFRLGWLIGGFSCKFIFKNKKLLVFPLLSAMSLATVVLALYGLPDRFHFSPIHALLLYFIVVFITLFFNVAAIAVINAYLLKEQPSITNGLKTAFEQIAAILIWTLVAALVGLILRIIEGIGEKLHMPILIGLFDMAWGVATYFVLPIMCFSNNTDPFSLVDESIATLRQCWGKQQFSRMTGSQAVSFVMAVPWFMLMLLAGYFPHVASLLYVTVAYGIFWVAFTWVLKAVLQTVYYRYAREDLVPPGMDRRWLELVCVETGKGSSLDHIITHKLKNTDE